MQDLSTWMDENWLRQIFAPTQALVSCKVIRHKTTQMSRGYGFLLFNSPDAANQVLTQLNGTQIPGTDQVFRLNLAANGRQGSSGPTDYSLFVGDLSEEVTDFMLQEAFKQFYPSVRSAKVMRAPLSGKSRNFGFCRFASEQERDRALIEMNGHLQICGKPVRVSLATAKKTASGLPSLDQAGPSDPGGADTSLVIGGLGESVTVADLQSTLALVPGVTEIKLLPERGCALVQFQSAASAKAAALMLQKQAAAGSPLRVSWGRQMGYMPSAAAASHSLQHAAMFGAGPGYLPGAYGSMGQPGGLPALPSLAGSHLHGAVGLDPLGHSAGGMPHPEAGLAGMGWPGAPAYPYRLPGLGGQGTYLNLGQTQQHPAASGLPSISQPGAMDLLGGYGSLRPGYPPPFG